MGVADLSENNYFGGFIFADSIRKKPNVVELTLFLVFLRKIYGKIKKIEAFIFADLTEKELWELILVKNLINLI